MTKRKKPPEAVSGSYTPVPHALLDRAAFLGASVRAKALLFDLLRQHNGGNNGHLQLSVKWLLTRGWTSTDQIQKAKSELLERGLVIKTRLGGLGIGPDQYALTWLNIADFKGLELRPGSYYPGAWRMLDAPPTANAATIPAGGTSLFRRAVWRAGLPFRRTERWRAFRRNRPFRPAETMNVASWLAGMLLLRNPHVVFPPLHRVR